MHPPSLEIRVANPNLTLTSLPYPILTKVAPEPPKASGARAQGQGGARSRRPRTGGQKPVRAAASPRWLPTPYISPPGQHDVASGSLYLLYPPTSPYISGGQAQGEGAAA